MKRILVSCIISIILFFPPSIFADGGDRSLENRIITAVEKYNRKEYADAVKILREVVKEDGNNDAAHYYLGMCHVFQREFGLAETEFKRAVELDRTNFWYRYRLATLYSLTDRKELTISMYEEMLRDFPKKSELYYDLIELYLSQNQQEKSLEVLGKIETIFGRSDATAMTRFDLLRRMDRQQEAIESLEEYNKEASSPQVLSILADYQISMYNDTTAVKLYKEALSLEPGYAPALLGLAETYRVTRKYDDYFKVINSFISDKTVAAEGKTEYLKALVQRSDPNFLNNFRSELDTMIAGCMSAHPKDSSVLMLAGIYYYGTQRNERAIEYFRENRDLYPESKSAAATYLEALMYMQKWPELSSGAMDAYSRFEDSPFFLEMASVAYYNMDEYEAVLDVCGRILEKSGGDTLQTVSAYSTMGDMHFKLGETSKAFKSYEKALKLKPDHLPVLNNYAYYLSLENRKLKKAYSMSKKTIEAEPDNPTYLDTFAWILFLQGKPMEAKPFFKHAMLYGGKDSPAILDHYAEVLYALKEYDLAYLYWNQAMQKNNGEISGLEEKIRQRKAAQKKD